MSHTPEGRLPLEQNYPGVLSTHRDETTLGICFQKGIYLFHLFPEELQLPLNSPLFKYVYSLFLVTPLSYVKSLLEESSADMKLIYIFQQRIAEIQEREFSSLSSTSWPYRFNPYIQKRRD